MPLVNADVWNMVTTRRALAADDESGFSTAETIVAITIAGFVMLAILGTLVSTVKGTLSARQNQQSAELTSRMIEAVRALPVADLANRDSDLVGNPLVLGGTGARTFDPDGTGPLAAESVLVSSTGRITQHRQTAIVNGTTYTSSTIVTRPRTPAGTVDTSGDYRRLTVVTTWRKPSGTTAERRTNTFVTNTRRGLPLPEFQWGATTSKGVVAGAQLVLPAVLTNIGARDAWRVSVASNPTTALTWSWRVDVDRDGVLDPAETGTLPVFNPDGSWSTGPVATDETLHMLAVADIPAGTPNGLRLMTISAASIAQPLALGAAKSFIDSVTVSGGSGTAPEPTIPPAPTASPSPSPTSSTPIGVTLQAVGAGCAGCNVRNLSLLNQPLPGAGQAINNQASVTYVDPMPVSLSAPIATSLANYCGAACTAGGRLLLRGGVLASTDDLSRAARWRYQVPNAMSIEKVNLSLNVVGRGRLATSRMGLTAGVYLQKGAQPPVLLGSATTLPPSAHGSDFRPVVVEVPFTATNFANNEYLIIKVVGVGDDDADLGYATTSLISSMSIYGRSGF